VVREVPGWAGLLALASLPLRFAQVHFANRLAQLGSEADSYLSHLVAISSLMALLLLPALWARAVFTRACARKLAGQAGAAGEIAAARAMRLPFGGAASYLYTAALAEILLLGLGWTGIALPVVALVGGLAATISPGDEKPGPFASIASLVQKAPPLPVAVGLAAVFTLGFLAAAINLYAAFQVGLWLAGAAPGIDASWWRVALSAENRLFVLFVAAGALTLVEPFWLAALTASVAAARSRQTGEDLRARFAELKELA
jgi:hypothetical protein